MYELMITLSPYNKSRENRRTVGTGCRMSSLEMEHIGNASWNRKNVNFLAAYNRQEQRANRVRTVPMPPWAKAVINDWLASS